MGLIRSIQNFFRPREIREIPIDPQSINDNHIVKAVSYENAELKGKIAKLEDELGKLRQREEDVKEEENVKLVLNKEKQELEIQAQGKVLGLSKFYERFFKNPKFRKKLGIYSFDRKTRLADFGDFAIAEDGDFVLLDRNGEVVLKMQRMKDMIQSVGALGVDINRGIIPVWLDKDGAWIENILEYEAPEIINTGDKLRFAKARKKPVYEIIQALNNEIGSLRADLEEAELINQELDNKINVLESGNRISERMAETSRSELNANEERVAGIDKSFRAVQRDLVRTQNINIMMEDEINQLERIQEKLKRKAERGESDTSFDDAINKIDMAKDLLRQKGMVPYTMLHESMQQKSQNK